MSARTATRCRSWILLLCLAAAHPAYSSGLRWDGQTLLAGDQPFRMRAVNYLPRPPADDARIPSTACQLARDLPLVAAAGANTVRTPWLSPDNEPILKSLLETTGLYWLAGFSLEPYYDPEVSIQEKKEQILNDLRQFAERQFDNDHLLAIVIGDQLTAGYDRKFAGSPQEFYQLLSEAAELLRKLRPDNPPLVATVVRLPEETETVVPGLSFWIWTAEHWTGLADRAQDVALRASAPVLIEGFLAAVEPAPAPEPDSDEEPTPAAQAGAAIRALEDAALGLGFSWALYSQPEAETATTALFRSLADETNWESLSATDYYEMLAELWQGRRHGEWSMEEPPRLDAVVHAASGHAAVAPGGLARIRGRELAAAVYAANGVPWPLHQGETCLCAGGRPLPVGMLSPENGVVLLPWEMEPGEHDAVYYRAGKATSAVQVRVETLAPGLFEDAIHRDNELCVVSADNGIRPGERVSLYGTGFGPGAPLELPPRVWVNGQEAEVLYAGLVLSVPGLTRIDIRIDPATLPSQHAALVVRSGGAAAEIRVRVEAPSARYGIRAQSSTSEIVVQAGGPPVLLPVQVDGLGGYCGPVAVAAKGLPPGVSAETTSGWTGSLLGVPIQAAAQAAAQKSTPFVVWAQGDGAVPFELPARITVLPSQGLIPVWAHSSGFRSGYPRAQFRWNGEVIFDTSGGGPGRGINVLAADPATGVFTAVRSFDTWGDENASAELVSYLHSLPDGTLVLFAVADEASRLLSPDARATISRLFFSRYIWLLDYQQSWALIGRKGFWPFAENWSAGPGVAAFTNVYFPMR